MRDAEEAQRFKIAALERELADARRTIAELEPKAARAGSAEARSEKLQAEIARLEAALAPGRRQGRRGVALALAAAVLALGIGGLSAFQRIADLASEARRAREDAGREIDATRATTAEQLARAESELLALRGRAEHAEQRVVELGGELERERIAEAELRRERSFVALDLASTRVRVTGRDDLGRECRARISPNGSDCRATVTCGEVEIYPSPGHGGFFTCDAEHGHLTVGRDVNGTAASGDPMLHVDGPAGLIVVSDGPHPAWSVEIHTAPM